MPTDGPLNVQTPSTRADWVTLLGPQLIPDYYKPLQDAVGAAVDVSQENTSFAASVPPGAYQQPFPGWTRKFFATTEVANTGFTAPAGSHWNCKHQSVVRLIYANIAACTGLRVFAMLAGGDLYASINGLGRFQLQNTGGASGPTGTNYIDADVHPILIECVVGADVPGHSGAGLWQLSTDIEQISAPWVAVEDSIKGLAGNGAFIPPEAFYGLDVVWVGSKAERISQIGASAFLQMMSWPVGY